MAEKRHLKGVKGLGADVRRVEGFNAKLATALTRLVGSMACAYAFCLIALAGLPAALRPGGSGPVAWFAQTFLQLVLLSVIMVGQGVQGAVSDERAAKTLADTEYIKDQVNEHTDGGIKAVLEAVQNLQAKEQVDEHFDRACGSR